MKTINEADSTVNFMHTHSLIYTHSDRQDKTTQVKLAYMLHMYVAYMLA